MTPVLKRQPFSRDSLRDAVSFGLAHPYLPAVPASLLERFLTSLVSSERLVIDVFSGHERVACAALLDNIQNPSDFASLELLGLRNISNREELFSFILQEAKNELHFPKKGMVFSVNKSAAPKLDFFHTHGFTSHYTTFEMNRSTPWLTVPAGLPEGYHWENLQPAAVAGYHSLVTTAFANNPEASIPSLDEMKENYSKAKHQPVLLMLKQQPVGFLTFWLDELDPELGEVNTIGLLPQFRRRELGRCLLEKCLYELCLRGAKKFRLTVAAVNENALKLYESNGFTVTGHCLTLKFRIGEIE